MAYVRKTHDEWWVQGNYGFGWEDVCCGEDRADALRLYQEYRENDPHNGYRIKKHRVKNEGDASKRKREARADLVAIREGHIGHGMKKMEWQLWDVGGPNGEDRLVATIYDEQDANRLFEYWNQGAPAGCVWLETHPVKRTL